MNKILVCKAGEYYILISKNVNTEIIMSNPEFRVQAACVDSSGVPKFKTSGVDGWIYAETIQDLLYHLPITFCNEKLIIDKRGFHLSRLRTSTERIHLEELLSLNDAMYWLINSGVEDIDPADRDTFPYEANILPRLKVPSASDIIRCSQKYGKSMKRIQEIADSLVPNYEMETLTLQSIFPTICNDVRRMLDDANNMDFIFQLILWFNDLPSATIKSNQLGLDLLVEDYSVLFEDKCDNKPKE